MCLSPSYEFTESVCVYCTAENAGGIHTQALRDHGVTAEEWEDLKEDWGTGHSMCGEDEWAMTYDACACRNNDHKIADPRAMFERMIHDMQAKNRERVTSNG
jgi:hypothetical protein